MSEASEFPRLRPGVVVVPFSTSARKRTCLVMLPDGRTLEASRRLADLLPLLDGEHDLEQIAARLSSQWQTGVSAAEVRAWTDQVLAPHDLIAGAEPGPAPAPARPARTGGKRGWLLLPPRLLLPVTNRLRFLFHPAVALVLLWGLVACHVLFYAEVLPRRLPASPAPWEWLAGFLTLLGSVLFHELGHLAACRYFGCPHGEIRIGVYLFFPVFYADVTPSWRLSRKERVIVDLGGAYFQSILLLPLFLVSHATAEPLARVLFLEVDGLIAFALNPFLRFDGYWVCSDLLGIPNLHARSRRLLAHLRARVFQPRTPPVPSPLTQVRSPESWGLALYALGRFVFLLSIAPLLALHLAEHLPGLPGLVAQTVGSAWREAARGNVSGLISHLGRLFVFALLLLAMGRLIWRLGALAPAAWRTLRPGPAHPGKVPGHKGGEKRDAEGLEAGRAGNVRGAGNPERVP